MIAFDLKCTHGHVFEAWFRAGADFDDQAARGLISCPLCGDTGIMKALMAPNVSSKSNRSATATGTAAATAMGAATGRATGNATGTGNPVARSGTIAQVPANPAELLARIAAMQADALRSSTWVGRRFATAARAMDAGDVEPSPIHGQATPAEARALADDGIAVMPLLVPVVPPELLN